MSRRAQRAAVADRVRPTRATAIDARGYGVTFDGVTNDVAAWARLVAALRSGDTIEAPVGTSRLDWLSPTLIGNIALRNLSNITIRGQGIGATVIRDARPIGDYHGESFGGLATAGTPSIGASDTSGVFSLFNCHNVTFEDLSIESVGDGTTPVTYVTRKAIYAPNACLGLHISRVRCKGIVGEVYYAQIGSGGRCWLVDCQTDDCSSNHANFNCVDSTSRVSIARNMFGRIRGGSHVLTDGGNISIAGNQFRNDVHYGESISLSGPVKFDVSHNNISGIASVATSAPLIHVWYPGPTARSDGLILDNILTDNVLATETSGGAIVIQRNVTGVVEVRGNRIVGNGRSVGQGECVGIHVEKAAFSHAGNTYDGTLIIDGNTLGSGGRNQNIGIRVAASAAGADIRIGRNTYDCTTPQSLGSGVTVTDTTGDPVTDIRTTAGPYTPARTAWRIVVVNQSVAAAYTLNLPASPKTGDIVQVKDGKGDAMNNNITIAGTIDGAASLVIAANYGAVHLVYNGTEWNAL